MKGRHVMPARLPGRVYPRGQPLPRKSEALATVLLAIVENADGSCGSCEGPLLRTWGWCPACGREIDWTADGGALQGGALQDGAGPGAG